MPSLNSINVAHGDRWRFSFSNMPSVQDGTIGDMPIYDHFVRSCTIPDLVNEEEFSYFKNVKVHQPVTKPNSNLSELLITFRASENLTNYRLLLEFMLELRYGQKSPTDLIRENVIEAIVIELLDNQKRKQLRLSFTKARLTNLGSLPLNFGTSEELEFNCSFMYQEIISAEI